MALPSSDPITLLQIIAEFGGPSNLRAYYRGGSYVPNSTPNQNISTDPNSLTLRQFLGASAYTPTLHQYTTANPISGYDAYGAAIIPPYELAISAGKTAYYALVGGGGQGGAKYYGGNIGSEIAAAGGGGGGKVKQSSTYVASSTTWSILVGRGGGNTYGASYPYGEGAASWIYDGASEISTAVGGTVYTSGSVTASITGAHAPGIESGHGYSEGYSPGGSGTTGSENGYYASGGGGGGGSGGGGTGGSAYFSGGAIYGGNGGAGVAVTLGSSTFYLGGGGGGAICSPYSGNLGNSGTNPTYGGGAGGVNSFGNAGVDGQGSGGGGSAANFFSYNMLGGNGGSGAVYVYV